MYTAIKAQLDHNGYGSNAKLCGISFGSIYVLFQEGDKDVEELEIDELNVTVLIDILNQVESGNIEKFDMTEFSGSYDDTK